MADDRAYKIFTSNGYTFLWELDRFLDASPMSTYWTSGTASQDPVAANRQSRLIIKHIETGEAFNLIQHSFDYQEILTVHSCADTIYRELYGQWSSDYWRLNYNVPASAVQLTYPVGTTPTAYLTEAQFTVVGTSQFIFVASSFDRGGSAFSSQGIFGFLDSYDDETYKVVGGLPTDTETLRPHDLEHHFWETGYQNFSARFVAGTTFHLSTFQVHDYDDLGGSYAENYLLPLVYFERGVLEYSGRIAGELYDAWRLANDATSIDNGDILYLGDADGTSMLAKVFKDGEELSKAIAVRYQ